MPDKRGLDTDGQRPRAEPVRGAILVNGCHKNGTSVPSDHTLQTRKAHVSNGGRDGIRIAAPEYQTGQQVVTIAVSTVRPLVRCKNSVPGARRRCRPSTKENSAQWR